jgi:hypothetical protein
MLSALFLRVSAQRPVHRLRRARIRGDLLRLLDRDPHRADEAGGKEIELGGTAFPFQSAVNHARAEALPDGSVASSRERGPSRPIDR